MTDSQWLPKRGRTREQAEWAVDARLQEKVGKELGEPWVIGELLERDQALHPWTGHCESRRLREGGVLGHVLASWLHDSQFPVSLCRQWSLRHGYSRGAISDWRFGVTVVAFKSVKAVSRETRQNLDAGNQVGLSSSTQKCFMRWGNQMCTASTHRDDLSCTFSSGWFLGFVNALKIYS